jgi:transposase-like protein
MKNLRAISKKSKCKLAVRIDSKQAAAGEFYWPDGSPIDTQYQLISLLIPSAVREFFTELNAEVESLCGKRNARGSEAHRWGSQAGSIYLGGQKIALEKPRVRGRAGQEVSLRTYEDFQDPRIFEEGVFRKGMMHVSQRDFGKATEKIAGAFGFKKSTVSKHWRKATEKKLSELQNRDISSLGILAVFIDGKRMRELGVVVALGVAEDGQKYTLGIYQASTENASCCLELLDDLERRGLPRTGLLFIVDGGSGLNAALERKYAVNDEKNRLAVRSRCHVHKWRNIEDALGKKSQVLHEAKLLFWEMRDAKDIGFANTQALLLKKLLRKENLSALKSFEEAEADLLIIHKLGLSRRLKSFFSTTNAIESYNSLLEEDLRRVKRWRDSEHFQRWVATSALHNEKRMRKIKGFSNLHLLKDALQRLCKKIELENIREAA